MSEGEIGVVSLVRVYRYWIRDNEEWSPGCRWSSDKESVLNQAAGAVSGSKTRRAYLETRDLPLKPLARGT